MERFIVWGGILVLLGLVALQAHARLGFSMTQKALITQLSQDDVAEGSPLSVNKMDRLIVGWPARTVEKHSKHSGTIELSWRGLTSTYGLIVHFDPSEPDGGLVLAAESKGFVEPRAPEGTADASQQPGQPFNAGPGPAAMVPRPKQTDSASNGTPDAGAEVESDATEPPAAEADPPAEAESPEPH